MKEKMFFISIALLAFLLNPASGAIVRINDSSAQPLGTNVTSIMLSEMNNFGSANIELYYNSSVVQVTSASLGFSGYGGSLSPNINNTIGKATFTISITALNGPNSPLTLVNVNLQAVGSIGQVSPLELSVLTLAHSDGSSVTPSVQNGIFNISISSVIPGDVTGNGMVDAIDSMFLAQFVAGTRLTLPQQQAGDVTPPCGTIDAIDTMFVAQYVAGTRASLQLCSGNLVVIPLGAVSINNATASPNASTSTQIVLSNMNDFGAATIDLYYNPNVVQVTSASLGFVGSGGALTSNINNTIGKARFVITTTAIPGPNSPLTLVNVNLQAVGSAGQTGHLILSVVTLAFTNGTSATPTVNNGTFNIPGTLPPVIPGDVTGNGVVDSIDAMFLAQFVAGTRLTLPQQQAGDVTPPCGTIDAIDTMFVAQYVAGTRASLQSCSGNLVVIPLGAVSINNATASPNAGTSTQIVLSNMNDFGAATIDLYYNKSVVNVSGATLGFTGSGGSLTPNINNTIGKTRFVITTTAIPGPNSPLTLVNVNLLAVGSAGQTSPLILSVVTLAFTNGTSATPTVNNGTFNIPGTLPPVIPGDVTGNGFVDAVDSMFLAQYVAGTRPTLPNPVAGDVASPCGAIDAIDSMFVAQYVAGTRTSLQLCS